MKNWEVGESKGLFPDSLMGVPAERERFTTEEGARLLTGKIDTEPLSTRKKRWWERLRGRLLDDIFADSDDFR